MTPPPTRANLLAIRAEHAPNPGAAVRYCHRCRVRWPIAETLNRLDSQCWADLVEWALRRDAGDWWADNKLPSKGGERCRAESLTHRDHTCYCGKFLDGERR